MNKKELAEVRKIVSKFEDSTLAEISLCYVSAEREIVHTETIPFLNIPEEEVHKYLEIFRKSLSGSFNKTLFHIDMADGKKEKSLLAVMQTKGALRAFYEKVAKTYVFPGNFLIVTAHGFYDYAKLFLDGTEDEESDYTYEYMLTAICPVELSKPGLSVKDGSVSCRILDWVVGSPKDAFLYPTFTDRTSNVHEVLYYSKNSKELQEELLWDITGNNRPHSEKEDREWFSKAAMNENDTGCPFGIVKEFHERAKELIEASEEEIKKNPDEIGSLLKESGMDKCDVEDFLKRYKGMVGERTEIPLENLVDAEKVSIKGEGFVLKTQTDRFTEIETRHINGRTCLVVPLTSSFLEINGVLSSI